MMTAGIATDFAVKTASITVTAIIIIIADIGTATKMALNCGSISELTPYLPKMRVQAWAELHLPFYFFPRRHPQTR